MDSTTTLAALVAASMIGIVAILGILRRQRRDVEALTRQSPYAVSTEGMKRCPHCGVANLVTDATCSECGGQLPG